MTPDWLSEWMEDHGLALWGAADLRAFDTPRDETGQKFPRAISWAVPMTPRIMAGIQKGPTRAYADEYTRVNQQITDVSAELAGAIKNKGFRSQSLAASHRTDTIHIRGDFPHKTAATRAGIGWIGRHCQLITRPFGSWVRLGTVFTDMTLSCGPPVEKSFCGNCHRCVDACPAAALTGRSWVPGVPRESLLDVQGCDQWKKQHYFEYHKGHNCGICAAVCPYGLKALKRTVRGANKNPGE
jgi:epoxyqueuosine reductase QueG